MILPPDLILNSPALTTSAVANTVTTGTQVGAPAANQRLRLWAYQAFPDNTAQAVVNWYVKFTSGVGGAALVGMSGSNFAAPGLAWIPGGRILPPATALGWQAESALASTALRLITYTTVEATS